jgi:hypothetical protein
VSVDGGVEQPGATPPLPRSIWVVALASLAGQAVQLVRQGGRLDDEISLVLSVVLGGLLVGYVSAGVVRTRTVRLVLAWVVLARFRGTDWYTWQRTKPSAHEGAPIGQLVAIGVLVGVLGGLTGPVGDGLDVRVRVANR